MFICNRYRDFSNNGYFFNNRGRNCVWSNNRNFIYIRFLNMMYISLMNIILYNWLCYYLICRYMYIFSSYLSIVLSWINDIMKLYLLIRLSIKLNINMFSLYNRLYKSVIKNFFTWSSYCFSSSSFL